MPHRLNEITVGGRTIRWRESDPAITPVSHPPALVLLHAFPLSSAMWERQFDAFGGWRVIAPDVRGFRGPDGPPVEKAGEPTMDELAMEIEHALDALGIAEAVIGGLSMGGYISFALYRRAPARFRGLVLADTRAGADTEDGKTGRRRMQSKIDSAGVGAIADEMVPKLLSETTRRERPAIEREVRTLIEANGGDGLKAALGAMMTRQDSRPLLQTISCPALVLVGEEDTLTPVSAAEEIHEGIKGSQLAIVPGAAHLANLDRPDAFNDALGRFLRDIA